MIISEEMVAIGVVVLAAGLPQICYRAIFRKVEVLVYSTLPYLIAQEIQTIPDWKTLHPNFETSGIGQQLEKLRRNPKFTPLMDPSHLNSVFPRDKCLR